MATPLVFMPRAYLDLGATYDAPPSVKEPSGTVGVISMAGYLANIGSWIAFNRKWRRLLRDNDVPDLIFHMNKFETRQGLYNGWSNTHRDSFIKKLLTILTDHVTLGVAGGVVTVDYYSFSEEEREILGSPYRLCASSVMGDLARWLQKNGVEERVSYVFELGDRDQGIFRLALNELLHRSSIREKFRIESADFRTKAEATGLQTGDIAAYEVCKHIPRVMGTEPRGVVAKARRGDAGVGGRPVHHVSGLRQRGVAANPSTPIWRPDERKPLKAVAP